MFPTPLFLILAGLWLALAVASGFQPELVRPWQIAGAAIVIAAVMDAISLRNLAPPAARRRVAGALPVGVWEEVSILLENANRWALPVRLHDHHPGAFESRDLPAAATLPARGWARITYGVRAPERGDYRFGRIEARARGPLGLLERRLALGEAEPVRVYPNFAALARFALLATDNRLSQIGVLQRRRRGEGMEFHQLREYRRGDSLKRIDWKATSRMRRLIAREYQDERDQAIVLLIDCGRRMAARDGTLSHFDAALNAALLLAHVSLHHGDAVGVLTMAGEPRFVAPRKSAATVTLLLNRLYDLQPSMKTPDYHAAALELMRRVHKRALVVVLSNLRDEDDETLLPALALLRKRHLVLFASLREQILGRALVARVTDLDRALTHAAAAEYLKTRAAAFRRLEHAGAHMLDVEPAELPVALVNRYLDIKRRGVL